MSAFPQFDCIPQKQNLTFNGSRSMASSNAFNLVLANLKRSTGAAFDLTNCAALSLNVIAKAGPNASESTVVYQYTPDPSAGGSGTVTAVLTQDILNSLQGSVGTQSGMSYTLVAQDTVPNNVVIATGSITSVYDP